MVEEVMHYMHQSKSKRGTLAVKIDLEKVYERVNGDNLQTTLEDFGFPLGTMTLIMFCVRSSFLTLLWNGSKLPSFSPTCCLK